MKTKYAMTKGLTYHGRYVSATIQVMRAGSRIVFKVYNQDGDHVGGVLGYFTKKNAVEAAKRYVKNSDF